VILIDGVADHEETGFVEREVGQETIDEWAYCGGMRAVVP
jgi:hypothetical protein